MAVSVEELVFDLSLDGLSEQRNTLRDVRARSATLLTASSIVTSFAGGHAIDAAGFGVVTGAALVAFFFTLVPAIHLLAASGEGRFSIEGARLYSDLAPTEASLERLTSCSPARFTRLDSRTARSSTVPSGRSGSGSAR